MSYPGTMLKLMDSLEHIIYSEVELELGINKASHRSLGKSCKIFQLMLDIAFWSSTTPVCTAKIAVSYFHLCPLWTNVYTMNRSKSMQDSLIIPNELNCTCPVGITLSFTWQSPEHPEQFQSKDDSKLLNSTKRKQSFKHLCNNTLIDNHTLINDITSYCSNKN